MIVFWNEYFEKEKTVRISPFDHGFLYGDSVYETLLVYGGKVFFVQEHFKRLLSSLSFLQISLPDYFTLEYCTKMCTELIAKNTLQNARLRITVSRGENHFDFTSSQNPTIVASLSPLPVFSEKMYTEGVSTILYHGNRIFPEIKHTNFLSGIKARQLISEKQVFEAIYISEEGYIREGSISNIFAVFQNEKKIWISPRKEVLPGTMQAFIENILNNKGYTAEEKNYTLEEAQNKKASLFLSNSLMGIMPIQKVGDLAFPVFSLFSSSVYELLDTKI